MFGGIAYLYQIDWRIFITGTEAWLRGDNPYGPISAEFGAGAFAYPPTALTWLALFVPFGPLSFYLWTGLQLAGWWWLARREAPGQAILLLWAPIVLHLVQGQSTLPMILILWAALRARQRGWLWGLALAITLTKPQVALLPLLWLLWIDRAAPWRWQLWGGIVLGTLLLALPPTLRDPGIWADWLAGLPAYRERILQLAAWQGPSVVIFALVVYLWHRSGHGGWHWWLTAGIFPQTSFYALVPLLPMLNPRLNRWTLAGLALAGVLQGPMNELLLPWILALHLLAAWMLAGGTRPAPLRRRAALAPH